MSLSYCSLYAPELTVCRSLVATSVGVSLDRGVVMGVVWGGALGVVWGGIAVVGDSSDTSTRVLV